MNSETAEIYALKALEWLVASDELRNVFLGSSGLAAVDIPAMAGDPDLLRSVVDFIAMDDEWVVQCCGAIGLETQDFQSFQSILGGGVPNWT